MRTKQGTLRGFSDDGFRIEHHCRGWDNENPPDDCSRMAGEELTPRDAKRAMSMLMKAGLSLYLFSSETGRLCPACAKAMIRHFARLDEEVRSETDCVCGHAQDDHAHRGHGTGSTFCIDDDCPCKRYECRPLTEQEIAER